MPKHILYAMEKNSLQNYVDHKNMIADYQINLSGEEISRIKAEIAQYKEGESSKRLKFDGDTAYMSISGVLEQNADPCAVMFGFDMTTYSEIFNAFDEAEKDENITNMTLYFDTPGGNVVGLFKTCDRIRNSRLNVTGIVTGMAASAGYALLTQCNTIILETEADEVGSIGVYTERIDRSEQDKKNGITRHILVSDNTPNKVQDISTESGRLQVIERMTKIKDVFIAYVANGRNTTAENVAENFGKGAVLIARDALNAGMIDKIESELPKPGNKTPELKKSNQNTTETKTTNTGENSMEMTKEELQAFGDGIATKAATTATESVKAEFESQISAKDEENKRIAGFQPLYEKFPNQKAMIEAEAKKEDGKASAEFVISLMETETSRAKAAADAITNSTDTTDPLKPDDKKPEDGESVDALSASMEGI